MWTNSNGIKSSCQNYRHTKNRKQAIFFAVSCSKLLHRIYYSVNAQVQYPISGIRFYFVQEVVNMIKIKRLVLIIVSPLFICSRNHFCATFDWGFGLWLKTMSLSLLLPADDFVFVIFFFLVCCCYKIQLSRYLRIHFWLMSYAVCVAVLFCLLF